VPRPLWRRRQSFACCYRRDVPQPASPPQTLVVTRHTSSRENATRRLTLNDGNLTSSVSHFYPGPTKTACSRAGIRLLRGDAFPPQEESAQQADRAPRPPTNHIEDCAGAETLWWIGMKRREGSGVSGAAHERVARQWRCQVCGGARGAEVRRGVRCRCACRKTA